MKTHDVLLLLLVLFTAVVAFNVWKRLEEWDRSAKALAGAKEGETAKPRTKIGGFACALIET